MNIFEKALNLHKELKGKLSVESKIKISSKDDLALLYTPGVAEACKAIKEDKNLAWELTVKNNMIAVVSDGSAVLGLGNIGPEAAMPVMEGKALLFKEFAGVNAIPLCISTQNPQEIITLVKQIAPSFSGINLEDISAPRCFEIEESLKEILDIPVFHDDQHGTAIVVGAALLNALKVLNKNIGEIKIVMNGIGAAGSAIALFLIKLGAKNIRLCDINGILNPMDNKTTLHKYHKKLAEMTNPKGENGNLIDALKDADVFIGTSKGNILGAEHIKQMANDAIIFAMANPEPEIHPDLAKQLGVKIMATGRSDFPNQVNNVLAFPGIFRGAIEVQAKQINDEMKIAACNALADFIKNPNEELIIPEAIDKQAAVEVAYATALAAIETGISRLNPDKDQLRKKLEETIL